MKPLSISELELLAEDLQTLLGGKVQKIVANKSEYGLGVWLNNTLNWIWIVLDKKTPLLAIMGEPNIKKKISSPLLLFFESHFEGKILEGVGMRKDLGRIVELQFTGGAKIELRLFPHACNLIASDQGKKVSWTKVQPIPIMQNQVYEDNHPRTPLQILKEWSELNQKPSVKIELNIDSWREQQREKIKKSIFKLERDIVEKRALGWREAGEWLKEHNTLKVPTSFAELVNNRETMAWNIQNCFRQAKLNEEKIIRSTERMNALVESLRQVEHLSPPRRELVQKKEKSNTSRRTLRIQEDVLAYFGKSAEDNLRLLRESKAWDYWMHAKDYPSAHLIISRPKNRKLSEVELKHCAKWLLKESMGKKIDKFSTYEFLITECRYVTPIRGDRIGRVSYKNERTIFVRIAD